MKMEESSEMGSTGGRESTSFVLGNMESSWSFVDEMRFGSVFRDWKSRSGG